MVEKQMECCRCGHLATSNGSNSCVELMETPCSHIYCEKCVHRLFSLQSRISCSVCGRPLFRHELSATSGSSEDQFHNVVTSTRRRVCSIMNGDRSEFSSTPAYDEFLEKREDLITKFLELYDTSGSMGREASSSREELEKILHKFEVDNQEKIIHARNTAEDRKRRKIEHIIEVEGTLFDRINVEYHERSSVIDHELAVHYADLLSQKEGAEARFTQHASADLLNRRTRLIQQQTQISSSVIISQPVIAEASGCKDLWKKRALDKVCMATSSLLHGAEVKEGILVSGDSTVVAFCRHENSAKTNFIFLDVNDKQIFCEPSVTQWLPKAVNSHLTKSTSSSQQLHDSSSDHHQQGKKDASKKPRGK